MSERKFQLDIKSENVSLNEYTSNVYQQCFNTLPHT